MSMHGRQRPERRRIRRHVSGFLNRSGAEEQLRQVSKLKQRAQPIRVQRGGGLRGAIDMEKTIDRSRCPVVPPENYEKDTNVCVAIPCTPNHWPHLPRALRSVRLQIRPADSVVVTLSHTSPESCAPLQAELSMMLPIATLVCWNNSVRYWTRGANRNLASRECAGRQSTHVAFIDADDEMQPLRLLRMLALMREHRAEVGVISQSSHSARTVD